MTSGVPWKVEGIPQQARETAQEAARRSGMSVGEWLVSFISDGAKKEGGEPARPPHDDDDAADINERTPPGRRAPAEDMAEVKGRLDEVGRQLDQLSRLNV